MKNDDPISVEQLANDHWDYVESVLSAHHVSSNEKAIAQHHYVSAFIHGYKHGINQIDFNSAAIMTSRSPRGDDGGALD